MKTTRPTRPRTNGTSTLAEPHGAIKPPHVNPIVYATVLEITRKLPLSLEMVSEIKFTVTVALDPTSSPCV